MRVAAGLTQAELAERAGVSERTISDVERGLRGAVYPATARQLAAALGVSPADLPGFQTEARGRPALQTHAAGDLDTFDRGGRVPIPLTRLLGRESDLALAVELVRDPAVRLVSIVGPGGIGKTRLAIEVANMIEGDFAGGSYFVSLSATDDPDMVLPLVAKVVGLTPETGELHAALSHRLAGKPTLVLLDTFEHVVGAATDVSALLEITPGLTVLATSRVPLHLRGEREVPLQPLAVRSDTDKPIRAPAVELFMERAAAVEPGFDASPAAIEIATDICSRLDGLPLAIELAAARVKHMPLGDLRRHLDHRLDPLVGGARDLPARQRTMRGTLDWSYALLGAAEMRTFRSLAAFRGGFGRDAVDAVFQAVEADAGIDATPPLMELVDSSLVVPWSGAAGEARYRLLDVTREYAVERSTAAGEFEGLRRRHSDYYLSVAQRAEPELRGAQQREWYARLHEDEANFRAALTWALEVGEADVALRLAGALWMFWRWAGLFAEGRAWLEAALAAGEASPLEVRCQGLWGAGWLAYHHGDYARTGELGRRMLSALAGTEDNLLRRNALTLVGNAALAEDRDEDAVAALEEALVLCEPDGTSWHLATSLLNLGTARLHSGLAAEARLLDERALAMYQELGDQHFAARAMIQVGYAWLVMGEPDKAIDPLTRAMEAAAELGDGWGIAEGLEAVATMRSENDPMAAAVLAGAAAQLRVRIAMRPHPADAVINRRYLERARDGLGAEEFMAATAEGSAMTVEEALELALA
jgi:predicted ATPase/DNA-binding XRE family transcriptional regulator